MKVLCVSGSRADFGGVNAVHKALLKINVDSNLIRIEDYDEDDFYPTEDVDIAVLLGDRYEVLRAATDIYLCQIPIAHLSGGDITEGSQDDCMRHAITKLSHLHFPTNEESAQRIIQMGEEPWRVHAVGYPGVNGDNEIAEFSEIKCWTWGFEKQDFILVVWHPNTFASIEENMHEVKELTTALDRLKLNCVVIGPNKDKGHDEISKHLFGWTKDNKVNSCYSFDLPRPVYLSMLQHAQCLVGNSSSGIYEAPTFGTPVVNIGDRQKGRIKALNIIDCPINTDAIEMTVKDAISKGHTKVQNPYHKDDAALRTAEIISRITEPRKLLIKRFCEIRH